MPDKQVLLISVLQIICSYWTANKDYHTTLGDTLYTRASLTSKGGKRAATRDRSHIEQYELLRKYKPYDVVTTSHTTVWSYHVCKGVLKTYNSMYEHTYIRLAICMNDTILSTRTAHLQCTHWRTRQQLPIQAHTLHQSFPLLDRQYITSLSLCST